jgi:anti-sigma factor ChrR (cupin superfamily)
MTDDRDEVEFDDVIAVALAASVSTPGATPRAEVKSRLLARVRADADPPGFSFRFEADNDWMPHPIPGIRMKVLAENRERGYVTLLLDVAPGTHFPPHHHSGAEECYVVSGTVLTCGRRLTAGDFVHADGDTDHGELFTDEGCRVILIVPPEDYLPAPDER